MLAGSGWQHLGRAEQTGFLLIEKNREFSTCPAVDGYRSIAMGGWIDGKQRAPDNRPLTGVNDIAKHTVAGRHQHDAMPARPNHDVCKGLALKHTIHPDHGPWRNRFGNQVTGNTRKH